MYCLSHVGYDFKMMVISEGVKNTFIVTCRDHNQGAVMHSRTYSCWPFHDCMSLSFPQGHRLCNSSNVMEQ